MLLHEEVSRGRCEFEMRIISVVEASGLLLAFLALFGRIHPEAGHHMPSGFSRSRSERRRPLVSLVSCENTYPSSYSLA